MVTLLCMFSSPFPVHAATPVSIGMNLSVHFPEGNRTKYRKQILSQFEVPLGDDFTIRVHSRQNNNGEVENRDGQRRVWLVLLRRLATGVHCASCPELGSAGGEACAPTSGSSKQYAAGSIDKGFVSKLRMAMNDFFGKRKEEAAI